MHIDFQAGQRMVWTHKCGDCESGLLMPRVYGHYEIRCRKDPTHVRFVPKGFNTRRLYDIKKGWVEYDVMTQRETNTLATRDLPKDEREMLARCQRAIGVWPQNMNENQRRSLALIATMYELDPLMEEIIPYQGKPYITIKGRRRLDLVAGNHPKSLTWRPLTPQEYTWYKDAEAFVDGDLVGFCTLTTRQGDVFDGFGKVTKAEREQRNDRGGLRSPVVANNPIEMFQNRSERRARERAYGPVLRPSESTGIRVLEEGDESNIIEGSVVSENQVSDYSGEFSPPVSAPPKEPPAPPRPDSDEDWDELTGQYGQPTAVDKQDDYRPTLPGLP